MKNKLISLTIIIWAIDVLDFPGMDWLDATIKINFLAWWIIWVVISDRLKIDE